MPYAGAADEASVRAKIESKREMAAGAKQRRQAT
jgi:hypothetical protein